MQFYQISPADLMNLFKCFGAIQKFDFITLKRPSLILWTDSDGQQQ